MLYENLEFLPMLKKALSQFLLAGNSGCRQQKSKLLASRSNKPQDGLSL